MSVLLDTGFLYAFANKRDENHQAAVVLMRKVAEGAWGTPAISDAVVFEFLNLVRARRLPPATEALARGLLHLPRSRIPALRLLSTSPITLEPIVKLYEKHRDRRLSFTDASLLIAAEEFGIPYLATFDKGFKGLVATLPD